MGVTLRYQRLLFQSIFQQSACCRRGRRRSQELLLRFLRYLLLKIIVLVAFRASGCYGVRLLAGEIGTCEGGGGCK